jgi:hypothetical protein
VGLLVGSVNINRGGPYKWPTPENGGIFGGRTLIRPAKVNRFLEAASVNQFYEAIVCNHLG